MSYTEIDVHNITLPNESLSNFQIIEAVKKLHIPKFRGVFLRNELPKKPWKKECGILNLDDDKGTHWVAWYKCDKNLYFDSYGIQPPKELEKYLGNPIYYSTDQVQPVNTQICGHLCLFVLKKLSEGESLQDIANSFL